ncbi:hypothetical protein [Hafnia paralvei]|uniref:hypothetical protein n=1 Tax=Hafnia paralvei TaxID=546367 RepID=UPI003A1034F2
MMTSREQFEAWVSGQYPWEPMEDILLKVGPEKERYYLKLIQSSWEAWQASREAVEIDIDWPEANDDTWKDGEEGAYAMGHEEGKDKVIIAVRKAIRAAGIKVKGE